MMTTLLVPVDDSAAAVSAVRYAGALARSQPGTHLLLLNVQQSLERRFKHGLHNKAARDHLKECGERAASASRSVLDRSACSYEFMIAFGCPGDVIARVANERRCHGIVMGTRNLGALGRLLFGSVAGDVLRQARVPVTLVPPDKSS